MNPLADHVKDVSVVSIQLNSIVHHLNFFLGQEFEAAGGLFWEVDNSEVAEHANDTGKLQYNLTRCTIYISITSEG